MNSRMLMLTLCATGAAIAQAQIPSVPTSLAVRGGYFIGGNFGGSTPGSSVRLEGFELGLDMPLFSLPVVEFRLSPTVAFGGSTGTGNADGDFYRIIGDAKFNLPGQNWYVAVGTGYGFTVNGGGKFDTTSGMVGQLTLGLQASATAGIKPYYELSWVFGKPQLTGVGFDVGIRF